MTSIVSELWEAYAAACPGETHPVWLTDLGRSLQHDPPVAVFPADQTPAAVQEAARMLVETGARYWALCSDWLALQGPSAALRARDEELLAERAELSNQADALRRQIAQIRAGQVVDLATSAERPRWWQRRPWRAN